MPKASHDCYGLGCRKGDLWVLSNAPFFAVASEGVYDRTKLPWVAIVQSLWHGPNQDGRCGTLCGTAIILHPMHLTSLSGTTVG